MGKYSIIYSQGGNEGEAAIRSCLGGIVITDKFYQHRHPASSIRVTIHSVCSMSNMMNTDGIGQENGKFNDFIYIWNRPQNS